MYLGETKVPISESPFANYTPADWAMEFIERYGQIDGEHHKLWVLDQVARILKGCPITVSVAKWDDSEPEWRFQVGKQSDEYKRWARNMAKDGYDKGIAP